MVTLFTGPHESIYSEETVENIVSAAMRQGSTADTHPYDELINWRIIQLRIPITVVPNDYKH